MKADWFYHWNQFDSQPYTINEDPLLCWVHNSGFSALRNVEIDKCIQIKQKCYQK